MQGEVIHIMSDYRSGSTLLDQLLGAHPAILSVGELHHLRAYALVDRTLHNPAYPLRCSCGDRISDCIFWQAIESNLPKDLASLRLSPRFLDHRPDQPGLRSFAGKIIRRRAPPLLTSTRGRIVDTLFALSVFVQDNYLVFDELLRQSSASFIVDSSKAITRCRLLQQAQPKRNRVILLCRDYRGVIHSKRSRGKSLESSARSWAERVRQMDSMVENMPPDRVHRLRYEDLCMNPETEMQQLCEFLSLEYSPDMISRPTDGIHQIGGSPSKLQADRRKIRLDTAYKDAFTADELELLRSIVGDTAKSWGYD